MTHRLFFAPLGTRAEEDAYERDLAGAARSFGSKMLTNTRDRNAEMRRSATWIHKSHPMYAQLNPVLGRFDTGLEDAVATHTSSSGYIGLSDMAVQKLCVTLGVHVRVFGTEKMPAPE